MFLQFGSNTPPFKLYFPITQWIKNKFPISQGLPNCGSQTTWERHAELPVKQAALRAPPCTCINKLSDGQSGRGTVWSVLVTLTPAKIWAPTPKVLHSNNVAGHIWLCWINHVIKPTQTRLKKKFKIQASCLKVTESLRQPKLEESRSWKERQVSEPCLSFKPHLLIMQLQVGAWFP